MPDGRGRFAPSPTGAMHLGNARTALLAWLDSRSRGGGFVLRIEDLDRARVRSDAEAHLVDDLRWLGLDWDEGPDRGGPYAPYRQSERAGRYDAAIDRLLAQGRAFFCACSRADLERAASAPQASVPGGPDDHGPRYPGTCRWRDPQDTQRAAAALGRQAAVRFDGRGERIDFTDEVRGAIGADAPVDDFVLRNGLGVAAYHFAVVVDDAAMRIDRVVRGDDLLSSTPRQIALSRALGLPVPAYAHVPLVLAPGGGRLAKRTRPASIAGLRAAGRSRAEVLAALAASAGLEGGAAMGAPEDWMSGFELGRITPSPAVLELR
jgi:glutamyl-tRNA synthetase